MNWVGQRAEPPTMGEDLTKYRVADNTLVTSSKSLIPALPFREVGLEQFIEYVRSQIDRALWPGFPLDGMLADCVHWGRSTEPFGVRSKRHRLLQRRRH